MTLMKTNQPPSGVPVAAHRIKLPTPLIDPSGCRQYTFTSPKAATYYVVVDGVYVEGHGSPAGGSYSYTLCPVNGAFPSLVVYEK